MSSKPSKTIAGSPDTTGASTQKEAQPPKLNDSIRKVCELFRLLAGHELLGLAPGEIAKGLDVGAPWVSVNLPAIAADTGFVERVDGTNRWRLGVPFVRIAVTVGSNLSQAQRRLDELSNRYAVPAEQVRRYSL